MPVTLSAEAKTAMAAGKRTIEGAAFDFPRAITRQNNDSKAQCATWGITAAQFVAFITKCKTSRKWNQLKTTIQDRKFQKGHPQAGKCMPAPGYVSAHTLNQFFIKPLTAGTGCGLALLVNNAAPKSCDLMLSHSWNEDMDEVVNALQNYLSLKSLPTSTVVWFCCFALYQPGDAFGPTVSVQCAITPPPFEQAIAAAKKKLGMACIHTDTMCIDDRHVNRNGVDNMYSRLWCVYELHAAKKLAAKTYIAPSDKYLVYLMKQGDEKKWLTYHVKCDAADCSDEADKKFIRSKMSAADMKAQDGRINVIRRNLANISRHLAPGVNKKNATVAQAKGAMLKWRTVHGLKGTGAGIQSGNLA